MDLLRELKHAARGLAKSPGFTAVAVLTLALAIGVNSVIFGLVDAVLFRPLPVRAPEELVRLSVRFEGGMSGGLSFPELRDYREQADGLTGLAGFSGGNSVNLSVGEEPAERVEATVVSGNFFSLLGVTPTLGRLLNEQDDVAPGGQPVLVLSEAFWRRRFGGDPGVAGTTVRINTQLFTIVGVAPRQFYGAELESVPDVWIPLTMLLSVTPNMEQFKPFERRGFAWVDAIGRLRPGTSAEQAAAELNTIRARVARELKRENDGRLGVAPLTSALLSSDRRETARRTSWILLGVTALVLVIACAVVAGLLLARGELRQREVALRSALGASRVRILGQLMAESLLIAVAACGLGVMLAMWTTDLFIWFAPPTIPLPTAAATPVLESRALWFAGGLAALSIFVFGLLPAWRGSRANLMETIRQQSALTVPRRPRVSLRNAFVVTQVALSAVLLVGAGLLLRTLQHASGVNLGFDTHHGLVISVDVSKSGYDRERGMQFYRELLERVRRIPGVRGAAISRHIPVSGSSSSSSIELTSFTPPPGEEPHVAFTAVSPGFFRTLGISLEQGRDFSAADEHGASVLIVNRAFADRFWPGRNPLLERVKNFGEQGAEVIGVAANVRQFSVRETPEPMLYVPDFDFYMPNTNLVLRTEGSPAALLPAVMAAARDLDPKVPFFRARTLEEHIGLALGQERMVAGLLSAFAFLALVLAAVGLYGLISYTTQVRRREFGIRLAVGALPRDLLRLVIGQGAVLAGVGLSIGLAASLAASQVLSALLFGIEPTDRLTLLGAAGLLMLVAVAASALPARRAAKVDPLQTLRSE